MCSAQEVIFENCFTFGTTTNNGDVLGAHDGGYYLAVNTMQQDSAVVFKFNDFNSEVWRYRLPTVEAVIKRLFEDADGNVYVASAHDVGSLLTIGQQSDDICLIKLNPNGEFIWEKHFGGTNMDRPTYISENSFGDLFVTCGGYSEDGLFSENHGPGWGEGLVIVVSKETGDLINSSCIGGSLNDEIEGAFATDTGMVLIGLSSSNDGDLSSLDALPIGEFRSFFLALDIDANVVSSYTILGNTGNISSVAPSTDGRYYCTGMSNGQGYVSLVNSAGVMWQRLLEPGQMNRIIATSDGGCLAVGYSEMNDDSVSDGMYAFFVKYDDVGNLIWKKHLGIPGSYVTFASSATELMVPERNTSAQEYVIGGRTNSGLFGCESSTNGAWVVRLRDDSVLVTTGINSIQSDIFLVYPNPVINGVITVSSPQNARIRIFDLHNPERAIFEEDIQKGKTTISLQVSPGMYFLTDDKTVVFKIILQ
jgi:hypothetical protein